MITPEEAKQMRELRDEKAGWCLALHGNHDEHQCHRKPGHMQSKSPQQAEYFHECYCGVWW